MPIYEFVCDNCKNTFERLVLSGDEAKDILCPKCHGKVHRLMSCFANIRADATPLRTASSPCSSNTGFS